VKTVKAEAYSNIALIKYMGKTDFSRNEASNPSLSYTLPHLKTVVSVIDPIGAEMTEDGWAPLNGPDLLPIGLSEKGRMKFLKHVSRLKDMWNYKHHILVESANNFPADCGIASSASSFAALTKAMALFLNRKESDLQLARLSRLGSGSSCRSFFGPWCLWNGENIEAVDLPYKNLHHMVVIVDAEKKSVSSSEAHLKVSSSPLFEGRTKRVNERMEKLLSALSRQDWAQAFMVTWDEFEDMHRLFETSAEPFSYRTENSNKVLEDCKKVWAYKKDGPLVTMDAGPNVHLLFREDQSSMYEKMKFYFSEKYQVIGSR
jgi:diphosphomevalonate decarboxylase